MTNAKIGPRKTSLHWKFCFVTMAIMLQFSVMHAAEIPADAATGRVQMIMSPPRLMRLDSVREWCHGVGYDACTVFISRELTVSCTPADKGWTLRGDVRILPRIYLANATRLPRENTRLRDIQHSTERYLDDIGGRRYPTEETCRQAGLLEEANFGATFRRFAEEAQKRQR